jgi:hypothetical protein
MHSFLSITSPFLHTPFIRFYSTISDARYSDFLATIVILSCMISRSHDELRNSVIYNICIYRFTEYSLTSTCDLWLGIAVYFSWMALYLASASLTPCGI